MSIENLFIHPYLNGESNSAFLEITLKSNQSRFPKNIIFLIDISGSMDECDSVGEENSGLSRLDLVKHSIKTAIMGLSPTDRIAIITFHTTAELIYPNFNGLQEISDQKETILNMISELKTKDTTNIYDALKMALNIIDSKSQHHILLFTDGQANVEPPAGTLATIKNYLFSNPKPAVFHCLGYGYNNSIYSDVLYNISTINPGGIFAYIPDYSMVGTVFINVITNILVSNLIDLTIKEDNDDMYTTKVHILDERKLVFPIHPNKTISVSTLDDTRIINGINPGETDNSFIYLWKLIELLHKLIISTNPTTDKYNLIRNFFDSLESIDSPLIRAMRKDLISESSDEGQIGKAFEKNNWYNKWGKHYLYSVVSGLENNLCLNFKDHIYQLFKSPLFIETQHQFEEIFIELEPPKPSVSMGCFYNSAGGCFSGNAIVSLSNGSTKKVSQLKKCDIL
jgi:hypothetical protein